jgi:hypothetical protein
MNYLPETEIIAQEDNPRSRTAWFSIQARPCHYVTVTNVLRQSNVGDKSTSAGVAVRRHAPSDGTESVRHITPQNTRTAA